MDSLMVHCLADLFQCLFFAKCAIRIGSVYTQKNFSCRITKVFLHKAPATKITTLVYVFNDFYFNPIGNIQSFGNLIHGSSKTNLPVFNCFFLVFYFLSMLESLFCNNLATSIDYNWSRLLFLPLSFVCHKLFHLLWIKSKCS